SVSPSSRGSANQRIFSLACVLNSFQNAEGGERNPLTRLAGFFYCKGLESFQVGIIPGSRSSIGMHFVKWPSSVTPSFVVENLQGGAEPPVICIAEFRDKIQTNKDVVVVMNGIVEPEPGTVLFFSIIEELSLEIKLDASLDRLVDPFRPFLLR